MRRIDMMDAIRAILCVVVLTAFFGLAFVLNQWWERWRASVWAEEMRKAGVKTEVPK